MAKMKKIPVEELKAGMIFDKPIYIDNSNMLTSAHTPIQRGDIKKLMTWGVGFVETAGILIKSIDVADSPVEESESKNVIINQYKDLLRKRKTLIETHKATRKAIKKIYNAISRDEAFKTRELEDIAENIIRLLHANSNIFLFLYGLDEGKDYILTHSVNVTFYALIIGTALKYDDATLRDLAMGTLLIDAGMIKVPAYILHKQSDLTEQELKQIKTHPLLGYRALKELGQMKESSSAISLQHHERFDGKGYPQGLRGNEIDEFSRIAAIADSYEAQISNRSYKNKVFFYQAMRNLLASGVNQFDPVILRLFLSKMSVYPIGSLVQLNNSFIGIVIGSIPEKPLRPIIKLIFDEKGKRIEITRIVNLLDETDLYITRALDENEVGIDIFDVL